MLFMIIALDGHVPSSILPHPLQTSGNRNEVCFNDVSMPNAEGPDIGPTSYLASMTCATQ